MEPAGVNRHAQRGMNAERLQFPDLLNGCDSARRGDLETGRGPQSPEPREISAFEHSFSIDVGAEESRAVWFELADRFLRARAGGFTPALYHNFPAFRIERDDEPPAADGRNDLF